MGAALGGSEEKAAVLQELLDNSVQMFVAVLERHSSLSPAELTRRCIGLVGAGEALSAAMVRGRIGKDEAARVFTSLIKGCLDQRICRSGLGADSGPAAFGRAVWIAAVRLTTDL